MVISLTPTVQHFSQNVSFFVCEQENIEKKSLEHQESIEQLQKQHTLQLEVHTHTQNKMFQKVSL